MARRSTKREAASLPPTDEAEKGEHLLDSFVAIGTEDPQLPVEAPGIEEDGLWVRESGVSPLEFLTLVYRHPLVPMKERITAARSVLEIAHRKIPQRGELSGPEGEPLFAGYDLSKLSNEELKKLEALVKKAQPKGTS